MRKLLYPLLCIFSLLTYAQDDAKVRKEALKQYLKVPIGTILTYAGDEASFNKFLSKNFRICKGDTLSRDDFPVLHYVIGSIWGSTDSRTFFLPDLRGRFLRGADVDGIRDPDIELRKDATGKSVKGVGGYQGDELGSHDHKPPSGFNKPWVTDDFTGDGQIDGSAHIGPGENNHANGNVQKTGGNETRPKNASVLFIIRVR